MGSDYGWDQDYGWGQVSHRSILITGGVRSRIVAF